MKHFENGMFKRFGSLHNDLNKGFKHFHKKQKTKNPQTNQHQTIKKHHKKTPQFWGSVILILLHFK